MNLISFNNNRRCFKTDVARILVVIMLMTTLFAALPLFGTDIAAEANAEAGTELLQGDRLTITDGDWSQEYIVLNPEKTNTRSCSGRTTATPLSSITRRRTLSRRMNGRIPRLRNGALPITGQCQMLSGMLSSE